jgi:hypothetical protein
MQAETTSETSALQQQTTNNNGSTQGKRRIKHSSQPHSIQLGIPLLDCTTYANIGLLATEILSSGSLDTSEILAFLAGPEIYVNE